MELGLDGKRALVAAASDGLGKAVAAALAAEGARVSICSRSEARIAAAAEGIAGSTGAEVHHAVCDVREAGAIDAWVDGAAERWGGIDLVVPNAGGPPPGGFADHDEEAWDRAFRLTLLSAVRILRRARPHLDPGSAVLLMTSVTVKEPYQNLLLSNVFRAGVASLAKTLSREWAPDGIRVNHLIPGRIATTRVASLDQDQAQRSGLDVDEVRRSNAAAIPLGRYGETGEFAAAAAFLLSGAASYISGATLQVDGGSVHYVL